MRSKQTVNEFLKKFPPNIRVLAENLRVIIKKTVTDPTESVYPGWRIIGYRINNGKKGIYFAFIAPYQDVIKMGFEYVVLLPDPDKLLQGNGNQVRYVPIRKKSDIKKREITAIIWEAAMLAGEYKFKIKGKR